MRAGVFLCQCGGNISGVIDLEPLAEHVRGAGRRRRGERQPVHVRHRRPRDDREGRGRARPRPLRHRLVLAALPGSDLRAHRARAQAGRELRGLRQHPRGLLLRPRARARARAGQGAQDRRGRRRPSAAHERPAAPAHLPQPLRHGGRRRHRRASPPPKSWPPPASRSTSSSASRASAATCPASARPSRPRTAPCARSRRASPTPRPTAASTSTPSPTSPPSPALPASSTSRIRHRPRFVDEKCVGCGECVRGVSRDLPQRVRLRRQRAHRDLAAVRQRRPGDLRRRPQGLEPLQDGVPRAHLRPGLRGDGRQGPLRGGVPGRQRAEPLPERLRSHLHARLRDRVHARQGGGPDRHRRHQALRRRPRRPGRDARGAAGVLRRARGDRRRRPRRPHRRSRARAVRLQGDRVRGSPGRRWHAARGHPRVPPAAHRAAGRDRPHHRPRRRAQDRHALRLRLHRRLAVRRRLQGRLPGDRPAPEQGPADPTASTSRACCAPSSSCARRRSARR